MHSIVQTVHWTGDSHVCTSFVLQKTLNDLGDLGVSSLLELERTLLSPPLARVRFHINTLLKNVILRMVRIENEAK